MNRRILVVEDEPEIRQLIALHLRREGFTVVEAESGDLARGALLASHDFALLILDWMVPGMSGLDLTRWIRAQSHFDRIPILFVTAKSEPEHVATALGAGADDYLTKPFETMVLMARVHALLRRSQWLAERTEGSTPSSKRQLRIGALTLNPDAFEAYLRGVKLELTRSEFKLLEALLDNQGKVLSREALIGAIQGDGVNVVGRTIDTHVFGIRKKLEDHADVIETIRGVGYRVRYSIEA